MSPVCRRDTFIITDEQLVDENFQSNILPLLSAFHGVDASLLSTYQTQRDHQTGRPFGGFESSHF
jgi:hypothetical protein